MDTISFITDSLDQVHVRLQATCDGLTQEQVVWRPAAYANNIGFILWHVARGEDRMITQLSGGSTDLWESEGLYIRFGQPVEMPDPGDRMGLRSLAIPAIDTLTGYLKAAHQKTSGYLATLSDDRLAEIPETYPRGVTVSQALRHLITHKNNHHGQVDFLRGLQDPNWDLPRGTGMTLPTA